MENKQTKKQGLVRCWLSLNVLDTHKKAPKPPQNPKSKAKKVSAISQNEVRRKYIILNFCKPLRFLTENSVLWNPVLLINIGAALVS